MLHFYAFEIRPSPFGLTQKNEKVKAVEKYSRKYKATSNHRWKGRFEI